MKGGRNERKDENDSCAIRAVRLLNFRRSNRGGFVV